MKTYPSRKHQKISAKNNYQISRTYNFKSKDNSKLIGKKRKRGKYLINEKGEESNETYTTGDTLHTLISNKFKKTKGNTSSILNDEHEIISSLSPVKIILSPISNKKEKFIKINNSNNNKVHNSQKKGNNINQDSFLNQSKIRSPIKRCRRKNKKYFFNKKVSRENLNRKISIKQSIHKEIQKQYKKIEKKFFKEITQIKKIKKVEEAKLDKEIAELELKGAKLDKEITNLDKKINELKFRSSEQDKKIKNQDLKLGILFSLYHHSDIYWRKIGNYALKLGFRFNKFIKLFKRPLH